MGDAPTPKPKPKLVKLVVRADAHIDEAWTVHGFASKCVPLPVSDALAKRLLADHPYLTIQGE